jgi:hypothetical protein
MMMMMKEGEWGSYVCMYSTAKRTNERTIQGFETVDHTKEGILYYENSVCLDRCLLFVVDAVDVATTLVFLLC